MHAAQIRSAIQQVRCGGVPQNMGTLGAGAGHRTDDGTHDSVDRPRRERFSASADEQVGDVRRDREFGAGVVEVIQQCGARGDTERDHPFLGAFTQDPNRRIGPIDVAEANSDEFRDANRRGIQQFPDCEVANGDGVPRRSARREVIQHMSHCAGRDHPRKVSRFLRGGKPSGNVRGNVPA